MTPEEKFNQDVWWILREIIGLAKKQVKKVWHYNHITYKIMKHKLVLLFAVSLVVILSLAIPEKPQVIKDEISPPAVKSLTPQEFLKQEIIDNGLADRDYLIMSAIIFCESGFEQYWPDGTVKVSNGNIGLAQINKGTHHTEYERLGLDPYDPYDNIRYAIILYKRGGITAWKQWSGHCFLPKLIKQGIIIN